MILSSLISCNYSLIHFYLNCFITLCLSFLRFFYQIFLSLSLSLFSPSCLCIYTSLSCPVSLSLSLSLSTSIPIYLISLNINQYIYSNQYLHFLHNQHNNNNKTFFIIPKGPFEARIDTWNATLQTVSEVLDEWIQLQRNWLYLQPIFDSADINKQLPLEGKRFATVEYVQIQILFFPIWFTF